MHYRNARFTGDNFGGIQRPAKDGALQGYAVEELHYHEGAAVFLADVVNGADVWDGSAPKPPGPRAESAATLAGGHLPASINDFRATRSLRSAPGGFGQHNGVPNTNPVGKTEH
jgi:hypothetical protein